MKAPVMESSQMTIAWLVEDFMITHHSQTAIKELNQELKKLYGDMEQLQLHTGDVHEYLGMTLDFQETDKVKVRMDWYVSEMVDGAP